MCGIAGIITHNPVGEAPLQRMLAAMHHRGPDDTGDYGLRIADCGFGNSPSESCHVAIGMRRLSIIDVAGGRQPIFNEDSSIAIVFNGEIYNYRELTNELKGRGHHFTTQSDTETIVHAYEEWGFECVHHLRGMSAFAILDARDSGKGIKGKREKGSSCTPSSVQSGGTLFDLSTFSHFPFSALFLARDRLGIKPLYYYQDNDVFVFASEVRALLASGLVPHRLSLEGLASYLAYGSVQEPLTLIDGVYSLPPGHWMEWKMENGEWKGEIEQYWDIPKPEGGKRGKGEKGKSEWEVVGEIREILREAVQMRLISEVPLGAFLSSGIDSSAVVALMSQVSDTPVQTFTITFNEEAFSEAEVARATARRLGTIHHEILVTPREVLADLPQALAAMDQPTMDGINTYYVSRATKRAGITVALSGLGGDELFAGYPTFRTVPRMMALQSMLGSVPKPIHAIINQLDSTHLFPFSLSPFSTFLQSDRWRKLGAFLAGETYFPHPYYIARALFTPQQQRRLLHAGVVEALDGASPWHQYVHDVGRRAATYDPINAVSYLECKNYLASTLLRDTDCMSMAHSLEVRVPLIDHELVELMMQLPGHLKIRNAALSVPKGPKSEIRNPTPKPLLVAALDDALPDEVVHQRKRMFFFPWSHWLHNELRSEVEKTLTTPIGALQGVLEPAAVANVWQQFLAGRTSWSRVWALYVLHQWVERNIG